MQKCVKMCQNSEFFWQSNDFPRGSKFSRASEGPQNGSKATGMDIPVFRDINGPAPIPKNGAISQFVTSVSLGLIVG